jgi:hypothetical protein
MFRFVFAFLCDIKVWQRLIIRKFAGTLRHIEYRLVTAGYDHSAQKGIRLPSFRSWIPAEFVTRALRLLWSFERSVLRTSYLPFRRTLFARYSK